MGESVTQPKYKDLALPEKCSVWRRAGVSVTAVVYTHGGFTVKTMSVDGVATIWQSVVLNGRDRADEITVVIEA